MRAGRVLVWPVAVVFAAALAACGGQAPAPRAEDVATSSSTSASPWADVDLDAEVAQMSTSGGLCPSGDTCQRELTVTAGGDWVLDDSGAVTTGTLDPGETSALLDALDATRLAQAPPATGECATAYDGSEVTYAWTTSTGSTGRAESCSVQIPQDDPLVTWFDGFAPPA